MRTREQLTEEEKVEYDSLFQYCGAKCITDPENCDCFGTPTKEMLDDIGETLEAYDLNDNFYSKEGCAFFDAQTHHDKRERENQKMSLVDLIVNDKELSNDRKSATKYVEQSLQEGKTSSEIVMSIATQKMFSKMGLKFKTLEEHEIKPPILGLEKKS